MLLSFKKQSDRPNPCGRDRGPAFGPWLVMKRTDIPGVTELGVVFSLQVSGCSGHPDYLHG